jgi:uncharacterized membrane protein YsdA (DUF1294 family)
MPELCSLKVQEIGGGSSGVSFHFENCRHRRQEEAFEVRGTISDVKVVST